MIGVIPVYSANPMALLVYLAPRGPRDCKAIPAQREARETKDSEDHLDLPELLVKGVPQD